MALSLAKSKRLDHLFALPGNPGTARLGKNIAASPLDFERIGSVAIQQGIGMVVVGPEEPLVKGLHDYFLNEPRLKHIAVIGPEAMGAQLEGSKGFAKQFMARYHIPTARYEAFTADTLDAGHQFLETLQPPYVLKADGLAAGKGVVILQNLGEAQLELQAMLTGKFGEASRKVVIEEYLDGIEMSAFALTDGENYVVLPEAKDYKRIGEGDTGPNTGGMGSVSPVPFVDSALRKKIETRIIQPTVAGLRKDNIRYTGFLFFGLMIVKGEPYVIEYNVRLGDPETQSVLARLDSDLLDLLWKASCKQLRGATIKIGGQSVATVVVAAGGYPGEYPKGDRITGHMRVLNAQVIQAGTVRAGRNLLTHGGRVLAITAMGDSLQQARETALQGAGMIRFKGANFRSDIGEDMIQFC